MVTASLTEWLVSSITAPYPRQSLHLLHIFHFLPLKGLRGPTTTPRQLVTDGLSSEYLVTLDDNYVSRISPGCAIEGAPWPTHASTRAKQALGQTSEY